MIPLLLAGIFVLSGVSSSGHDGPGVKVPGVPQYIARVHSIRRQLDTQLARPAPVPAAIKTIAARLRRLRAVALPDGRQIRTSLPLLAAELSPADVRSIRSVSTELNDIDNALARQSSSAVPASSLHALDDVLNQSVFHPERDPAQRLEDWLVARLHDVLAWFARLLGGAQPDSGGLHLGFVFFAAVLLFFVAVVGFMLAQAVVQRAAIVPVVAHGDDPATSLEATGRADVAARAGDHRSAIRFLLLSTLLRLQERGLLELRPGITNREYIRGLRESSADEARLRGPLGELVEIFDSSWYGHAPVDEADYQKCRELSDEAVALAHRSRVA